ncbi:membrane-bound lytic murein transglycosylase A [Stella humosa]|uniref:peptidoglycan lytic exotransglycosylase n=1 Tax=Stella humosa TaxID=94 RepID=A0A3N1MAP8_9PROT|nr:MltA domain-containing protein [Stella humosa]ROP99829.1 membrane-bound lytic murein transglycosylase A [Stella humosa]BBK30943.1 murein transglycosylase [Stella humosa]
MAAWGRQWLAAGLVTMLAACGTSSTGGLGDGTTTRGGRTIASDGTPIDPAFVQIPGWASDDTVGAVAAFRASCGRLLRQPTAYALGPDGIAGRVSDWADPCRAAEAVEPGPAAARRFFERWFVPVALGGGETGLFTGYYEPELRGSWARTAKFDTPLYRLPPKGRQMPTRAQIQAGALANKGLELLWVDDPVDAFFLEIQGSGRVRMTDGSVVGVEYAGQNGHPYFPVGRALVQWGELDQQAVSMASIREWMRRNPTRMRQLKATNNSHIFFRLRAEVGARGAMGVPLTSGRSLAVDPKAVPLGVPVFIDLAEAPTNDGTIRRLVVAQDTGGAIKGGVRGDLFWGVGEDAGHYAGAMRARGRAWILVPRKRTAGVAAVR